MKPTAAGEGRPLRCLTEGSKNVFFYQITCKKSLGVAFIGCPDQKTTCIHPGNRPIALKLPSQLPRFLPRAFDIVHRPVGGSGTDRYGVRMGTAPIGSRVVLKLRPNAGRQNGLLGVSPCDSSSKTTLRKLFRLFSGVDHVWPLRRLHKL